MMFKEKYERILLGADVLKWIPVSVSEVAKRLEVRFRCNDGHSNSRGELNCQIDLLPVIKSGSKKIV